VGSCCLSDQSPFPLSLGLANVIPRCDFDIHILRRGETLIIPLERLNGVDDGKIEPIKEL